jgi:hypothetical protein
VLHVDVLFDGHVPAPVRYFDQPLERSHGEERRVVLVVDYNLGLERSYESIPKDDRLSTRSLSN